MTTQPIITVLAGVNGAGKSSIAGEFPEVFNDFFFNPDTVARDIRTLHPDISVPQANAHAWQIGKELLEQAIAQRKDYRFETTLGGRTIPRLIADAAENGHRIHLWFCGLESVDLHLKRVRLRAEKGGHDIPEDKIRERWNGSRENLIRLLPQIDHLRIYDNSFEADPAAGLTPRPVLVLEMIHQSITAPADLTATPDWAVPILAAAMHLHRSSTPDA
jgi:predicted ABC-type ATPase